MKLIKCYISSFGKLKDFEYNFSSGLNVINEENGFGKSTFVAFIKSMFYGLNDKKKSILENERKKFTPWNSSDKFGGYVIFERNGNEFKIERFFGKRPIDDSVSLIDLKTGKIYTNQEDLGKRLFGVDEEGFSFSTYLSQNHFEVSPNATLTAKYNKTCELQDTDLFVKALEKLQDKSKNLIMRGDKGEINDIKRQVAIVKDKLDFSKNARTELENNKQKLKELDDIIERLKKEISIANESVSKVKSVVEYNYTLEKRNKLFKSLKELEEKKQIALDFFGDNLVKAEKVDEYIAILQDYYGALNTINMLTRDISTLKDKYAESTTSKTTKNKPLIIVSPIIFALCCLGFLASTTVGVITLVVGIIASGVFVYFGLKGKRIEVVNPLAEIILSKEKQLEEYLAIKSKYDDVLSNFISLFSLKNTDYNEALKEIKNALNEYLRVVNDISNVEKEIKSTALVPSLDADTLSLNADAVSENLKRLNYTMSVRERERGDLVADIKGLEDKIDNVIDLETQLAILEEKLATKKEEYTAISYAIEFLSKADENLKIKYREPLEKSLNKYLSYIGEGYTATIDVDFNVSILEKGALKPTEFYSEGLKNTFDLCKRFAIIDVLFSDEKPFIVLDDPFANFDKNRINSALKLINDLAKDYQILYLVCHESRCGFEE